MQKPKYIWLFKRTLFFKREIAVRSRLIMSKCLKLGVANNVFSFVDLVTSLRFVCLRLNDDAKCNDYCFIHLGQSYDHIYLVAETLLMIYCPCRLDLKQRVFILFEFWSQRDMFTYHRILG